MNQSLGKAIIIPLACCLPITLFEEFFGSFITSISLTNSFHWNVVLAPSLTWSGWMICSWCRDSWWFPNFSLSIPLQITSWTQLWIGHTWHQGTSSIHPLLGLRDAVMEGQQASHLQPCCLVLSGNPWKSGTCIGGCCNKVLLPTIFQLLWMCGLGSSSSLYATHKLSWVHVNIAIFFFLEDVYTDQWFSVSAILTKLNKYFLLFQFWVKRKIQLFFKKSWC